MHFLRIYLVPGAVLQSVMIGGGYGTGRELVEFFTRHGMGNGLLGMLLATALISAIYALTLKLAVRFGAWDYRAFFKLLLGPAWFLFEILGVMLFIVVLAIMGAAAGSILEDSLGLPAAVGSSVLLIGVVALNFFGREWVTRVLASWSVLLYAVFLAYFVAVATRFEPGAWDFSFSLESAWLVGGFQYALYNAAGIPIILYAARAIETERQGVLAGIIGGVIAMLPGVLFHLSFAGSYPGILDASLPVYTMFDSLAMPVLQGLYLLVLFGTFVETGAGNIQGFIERLDSWWSERTGSPLRRLDHAIVAAGALLLSGALSAVGIVDLIASGYGTLAWGYLFVYLLPLAMVGVWRLRKSTRKS